MEFPKNKVAIKLFNIMSLLDNPYKHSYLIAISLCCFIFGSSTGINITGFGYYLDGFDINKTQLGEILSAQFIGSLLIAPFLPALFIKLGVYNSLCLGILIRSFFMVVFILSSGYKGWALSLFGLGAGSFISYNLLYYIVSSYNFSKKSFAIGLACGFFSIGACFSIFLIRYFKLNIDTYLFSLSAFISILTIPILRKYSNYLVSFKSYNINYKNLFYNCKIPIIAAITANYLFFGIFYYLIIYIVSFDIDYHDAFTLYCSIVVGGIILSPIIGYLEEYTKSLLMLMILSIICLLCLVWIPYHLQEITFKTRYHLLYSCFILGSTLSGIYTIILSMIASKFKETELVFANLIISTIATIGGFAGIYITGRIIEKLGPGGTIYSFTSVTLSFLAYLCYYNYRLNQNQ